MSAKTMPSGKERALQRPQRRSPGWQSRSVAMWGSASISK